MGAKANSVKIQQYLKEGEEKAPTLLRRREGNKKNKGSNRKITRVRAKEERAAQGAYESSNFCNPRKGSKWGGSLPS